MRSQCSTFAVCARAISYCFVKASWHRRDRSHGRRSSQQFPSDYLPSVSTGPSSQWLDRPCTTRMVFPTSQHSSQAGRCCLLFHGTHQSEQATHFVGRLCGCNDSSHMAPAFRPSSTIKRAISACAGGFASIVLQPDEREHLSQVVPVRQREGLPSRHSGEGLALGSVWTWGWPGPRPQCGTDACYGHAACRQS